jgi:hypothetical protein
MESHCYKALFLAAGAVAFHGPDLQVRWKYVINHVRNFGFTHTCSHEEKDRCHWMEFSQAPPAIRQCLRRSLVVR